MLFRLCRRSSACEPRLRLNARLRWLQWAPAERFESKGTRAPSFPQEVGFLNGVKDRRKIALYIG